MENMSLFVKNFINRIYSDSHELKRLAMILLKSKEDCNYFFIHFFGRCKNKIDDLLNYREYKLSDSLISFDDFVLNCKNNLKDSFENTFLQPFNDFHIEMIEKAIILGDTSLRAIYNGFKNSPNESILKNVS